MKNLSSPIIHIGYHRTASTWFQKTFYPQVTNGIFVPRKLVRETFIEPRAFEFSPKDAKEKLLSFGKGDRLMICEENLSGYLHNGGLGGLLSQEMALRIHRTFPDSNIVIFLRSQSEIIPASYAQYIRGGGTHSLIQYLDSQKLARGAGKYWYKAPRFSFEHFNYLPLIKKYKELFGKSKIHIYLYEEFRKDKEKFIDIFKNNLNIKLNKDNLNYNPINTSLSKQELQILRYLNRMTARSVMDKQIMLNWDTWYERRWIWLERFLALTNNGNKYERLMLPNEFKSRITKMYGRNNQTISREWGLPLANHGYPLLQ